MGTSAKVTICTQQVMRPRPFPAIDGGDDDWPVATAIVMLNSVCHFGQSSALCHFPILTVTGQSVYWKKQSFRLPFLHSATGSEDSRLRAVAMRVNDGNYHYFCDA